MLTCTVSTLTQSMRSTETYQEVYKSLKGDGAIFLKQIIVEHIKVLVLCRTLSKQLRKGKKRLTP